MNLPGKRTCLAAALAAAITVANTLLWPVAQQHSTFPPDGQRLCQRFKSIIPKLKDRTLADHPGQSLSTTKDA
jgi:hypothetical protein